MWSGPRNISTALMRSFGNRPDTFVCDEPLYAHYLLEHGLDHPGRGEILERHDTDVGRVIAWLTGAIPEGKTVFYQKHLAHHLLPEVPRDWLSQLRHAFLIREPAEMLRSLGKVLPEPTLEDTGLPQQLEIFERTARETSAPPPVVLAREVLENPRRLLGLLCSALELDSTESMLSWPSGPRATDGVWAPHWYAAVLASTGFEPYQPKSEPVPERLQPLLRECRRYYDELARWRIR